MNHLTLFISCAILLATCAHALQFDDIKDRESIYLYAGDLAVSFPHLRKKFIGLSLQKSDHFHIQHDVTKPLDLEDNTVDVFQSEDVFEHIEYNALPSVLNEIYRVLKPGGICRISMPDYRCDLLIARSIKDKDGNIVFDPGGGGAYVQGKVINGGHLWFPKFESVKQLMENSAFTKFGSVEFLQYYDEEGNPVIRPTDYSICVVDRTPDFDPRVQNPRRPMSIVVDLRKN